MIQAGLDGHAHCSVFWLICSAIVAKSMAGPATAAGVGDEVLVVGTTGSGAEFSDPGPLLTVLTRGRRTPLANIASNAARGTSNLFPIRRTGISPFFAALKVEFLPSPSARPTSGDKSSVTRAISTWF